MCVCVYLLLSGVGSSLLFCVRVCASQRGLACGSGVDVWACVCVRCEWCGCRKAARRK